MLTLPCSLVRRVYDEAADAQGEQPLVETVVAGLYCELQQSGAREEQGGAVQITTYRLFLPAGTQLTGWDAVELANGETLELEGDATESRSPLTSIAYVEASVRRTDGEAG